MTSTTTIHHSPELAAPGQQSYDAAIATFNTDAHLEPDVATTATTPAEVGAAVLEARSLGLGIRTQTTGHAAKTSSAMTGDALIRTRMTGPVVIDPVRRTARVPAGTLWAEVVEAAAPYGLVAIHGSSPTVGVIGFLLRGGLSFYGRQYGVSANSLLSIDISSATGESVTASADDRPDLFLGAPRRRRRVRRRHRGGDPALRAGADHHRRRVLAGVGGGAGRAALARVDAHRADRGHDQPPRHEPAAPAGHPADAHGGPGPRAGRRDRRPATPPSPPSPSGCGTTCSSRCSQRRRRS